MVEWSEVAGKGGRSIARASSGRIGEKHVAVSKPSLIGAGTIREFELMKIGQRGFLWSEMFDSVMIVCLSYIAKFC
jgi:hypothetical protein